MIYVETKPGSKSLCYVATSEDFRIRTGIEPVLKSDCGCRANTVGCLCGIDAEATASKGNFKLDIGDKYDAHKYLFMAITTNINNNWPSKTGNPSGKNRGNNRP